jgi:hypothetical protein
LATINHGSSLQLYYRLLFWLFLLLHITLWTIGSSWSRDNLPFDTVESIAWGLQWQYGYFKHPPLAAWLNAVVFSSLPKYDWIIYLFAHCCAGVTFFSIWKLAKSLFQNTQWALIAVLLLDGMIFNNLISEKINPNQLMIPIWAVISWQFYQCLTKKSLIRWGILGILCGFCLLTKYQAPIQWTCMLLVMLQRPYRHHLKTLGPYLAAVTLLLSIMPHLYSLQQHGWTALHYASTSLQTTKPLAHLYYPLHFLIANAGACLPFILLSFYLWLKRPLPHSKHPDMPFITIMAWGPLILTCLFSMLTGQYLYPNWGAPFFSVTPIWVIQLTQPRLTQHQSKIFIYICVFFSFGLLTGRIISLNIKQSTHSADAFFPGKIMAKQVNQWWQLNRTTPLKYVAGPHYLIDQLTVYLPQHPIPYSDLNLIQSPWIKPNQLTCQNTLVIKTNAPAFTTTTSPTDLSYKQAFSWIKRWHHLPLSQRYKQQPLDIKIADGDC